MGDESSSAHSVNIKSTGSTVDLEDTYIYASGDVNVESKGALTLGFVSSGDIYASDYRVGGGAINLTSDTSDVTVYDYGLYPAAILILPAAARRRARWAATFMCNTNTT